MAQSLVYTGENKTFIFTDGEYKTNGSKLITDGIFTRCDGGMIQKDSTIVASFNFAVESGAMKNLWVNFNDPSLAGEVMAQINACYIALAGSNE